MSIRLSQLARSLRSVAAPSKVPQTPTQQLPQSRREFLGIFASTTAAALALPSMSLFGCKRKLGLAETPTIEPIVETTNERLLSVIFTKDVSSTFRAKAVNAIESLHPRLRFFLEHHHIQIRIAKQLTEAEYSKISPCGTIHFAAHVNTDGGLIFPSIGDSLRAKGQKVPSSVIEIAEIPSDCELPMNFPATLDTKEKIAQQIAFLAAKIVNLHLGDFANSAEFKAAILDEAEKKQISLTALLQITPTMIFLDRFHFLMTNRKYGADQLRAMATLNYMIDNVVPAMRDSMQE